MAQLFGYSLDRKKKGSLAKGPSFVRKDSEDAAEPIVAGGYFGQYVDFGDKESSKVQKWISLVDIVRCLCTQ